MSPGSLRLELVAAPAAASARGGWALLAAGLALATVAAGTLRAEMLGTRLAAVASRAAGGGRPEAAAIEPLLARIEKTSPLFAGPRLRVEAATLMAAAVAAPAGTPAERSPAGRALALAREASAVAPGFADAHVVAGASLADLGADPEEVRARFRRAAALEPMRAGLRRRLGKLYLATGNLQEAMDECRLALSLETHGAEELFAALEAAGGPSAPEAATPPQPRPLVALAAWREAQGDRDRARASFTAALALADAGDDPREQTWATRLVQGFHLRQRSWDDAERLAAARLAAGRFSGPPEEARLNFDIAEALLGSGRAPEATARLEEAYRLDPDEPAYGERLADAHLALGRADRAEALLAAVRTRCAAARTCPDESALRLKRAVALQALSRLPEARAEVVRVLQRHPDHAGARRLAQSLTYD